MLNMPNSWPIMVSLVQPLKFWCAADHTGHLILGPKVKKMSTPPHHMSSYHDYTLRFPPSWVILLFYTCPLF